jgi:hypothetical protein
VVDKRFDAWIDASLRLVFHMVGKRIIRHVQAPNSTRAAAAKPDRGPVIVVFAPVMDLL